MIVSILSANITSRQQTLVMCTQVLWVLCPVLIFVYVSFCFVFVCNFCRPHSECPKLYSAYKNTYIQYKITTTEEKQKTKRHKTLSLHAIVSRVLVRVVHSRPVLPKHLTCLAASKIELKRRGVRRRCDETSERRVWSVTMKN